MADRLIVDVVNVEEMAQALEDAPRETYKYFKERFGRFGGSFRKRFIRKRMRGRPGIKWDEAKVKVGGNVKSQVKGAALEDLRLKVRLSRLLAAHETGATIRPLKGAYLYLSKKTWVKGKGLIFAKVRQVVLPARLGFRTLWTEEVPKEAKKWPQIAARAIRSAIARRAKTIERFGQAVANL